MSSAVRFADVACHVRFAKRLTQACRCTKSANLVISMVVVDDYTSIPSTVKNLYAAIGVVER